MSETNLESGILNSIPDIHDDAGGVADGGSHDAAGGGDTGGSGSGSSSAAPSQQVYGQDGQQGQVVHRRHDGLLEVPNADNPNTRDLVDPVTGRTVAQGGIERRVYEEGQRHQRENQQLRGQVQQMQTAINTGNSVLGEAQRMGITPDQHVIALRVMNDFMRDPVRTLQYLVEEVKSKGYNIPFLSEGVTQGMDMGAFARMMDAKLAPFQQVYQAQQQSARVQAEAKQTLDTFISYNPAAQHNLDVIGEMLQAEPGMTLDRAFTMMVQWAVSNGLDYSRPLKPQLSQRQQPTYQQPTQHNVQQTRPLPGARSALNGAVARADANGQYSENASWSDIVRSAMNDSGMLGN